MPADSVAIGLPSLNMTLQLMDKSSGTLSLNCFMWMMLLDSRRHFVMLDSGRVKVIKEA